MRLPTRLLPLAIIVAAACSDGGSGPGTSPVALRFAPVDSGLDFPVFAVAPPGDPTRLLVLERGGVVHLRKNGVRSPTPFADLTGLTGAPGSGLEYGVLGLAFHPQYGANRRFFVYYINPNEDARLVEMRAAASFDAAEPDVVDTLLALDINEYAVHYGGTIGFGPDGMLYVGLGDGETGGTAASSPAQDSTNLRGKMLRLDVDAGTPYAIPPDNPFLGRPDWAGEIWHLGLRNPYRWSFDRQTGDLWLGDVGEDAVEELDFLPAGSGGLNLGWPYREGSACFLPPAGCRSAGLTPPFLVYDHGQGCSITGGHVYRGAAWPALRGYYLYGDFCRSLVRVVRRSSAGAPVDRSEWALPVANDNVTGFGEDAAGEVYVVLASGRVYRVELALPD
ncbi:MAG TPA: PQQ-dependent sugar dehydrogenase [Gemmatimonadales bacterium]|nr:PQQ-dependent sugar dehydrogenase [Gemmatimonadales bacterium]